jgi:sulfur relay (sulfurtransferase) complex TusBCD TusD component (DsrE family)
MELRGKKLGVMVSSAPDASSFECAYRLADAALGEGVQVYLYYMDEGVRGVGDKRVQGLKSKGAQLFACAYSAQRRDIPIDDSAVFSGLATVTDLMAGTNRFLSFT